MSKKYPVTACRCSGTTVRFFGKYKDPKSGKWLRMRGGRFPEHINTHELAEQFAERWYEIEIASQGLDDVAPVTWSDICDCYISHIEDGGKGTATKHESVTRARSLRDDVVLNSRVLLEHDERLALVWLKSLEKEDVRKRGGAKAPRKFKTVRNVVKVVKYVYRFAQSHQAFPKGELPTSGHLFQERMKELKKLDENGGVACPRPWVTKLLKHEDRKENRRLLDHMGVLTLARPGELHGLQFKDIQVRQGVVFLDISKQFSLSRGKTRAGLSAPKTRWGTRKVPVHQELLGPLKSWMSGGWEALVGRPPTVDDFLFVDKNGNPYREHDADGFRAELKAAGAGTEINGEPLIRYSLRHTGSTEALKAGVSSEARDRLLGHKPKDTKGQHYEEPDLRYLAEQINKIPGFLIEVTDSDALDEDEEPQVWSRVWSRKAAEALPNGSAECDDDDSK